MNLFKNHFGLLKLFVQLDDKQLDYFYTSMHINSFYNWFYIVLFFLLKRIRVYKRIHSFYFTETKFSFLMHTLLKCFIIYMKLKVKSNNKKKVLRPWGSRLVVFEQYEKKILLQNAWYGSRFSFFGMTVYNKDLLKTVYSGRHKLKFFSLELIAKKLTIPHFSLKLRGGRQL